MIAIIGNELEIVTDDADVTLMDSDGNTYSFQLTEAQLLQTEGHSPGSVPEDVPAGDLNGDKGKGAPEPYEGGGDMVTDDADATLMDSDGNTYSFQLTEAQLLQTEGHSPGSVPEDVPAGDLNGDKGKGDLERYEGDGDMVTDDADATLMDSDGNTYSFQLTEAQLLQTEGHTQGSVPGDVPAGDLNGDKGKSAPEPYEGDGDMVMIDDTDATIWSVDSDGNVYSDSYQLTEAEVQRLPDAAHTQGSVPDDVSADDLGAAADMVMDGHFFDLIF